MKQIKSDLLNPFYSNQSHFATDFIKNTESRLPRLKPEEGVAGTVSANTSNPDASQNAKSILEKHREEFKDMPKAFFDAVKQFEKSGYPLDKSDLYELKALFQKDAPDSESIQFTIDKQLPIHADIMSDVKNYLGASLLDFIDLSKKHQDDRASGAAKASDSRNTRSFQTEPSAKNLSTSPDQTQLFVTGIDEALEQMLRTVDEHRAPNASAPISDQEFLTSLKELKQALHEHQETQSEMMNPLLNAAFLTQNYDFKLILEEKITPKIAQVKSEFEELKLTISGQLEKIRTSDSVNHSALLAKTIELLDNAIMKSDISLYMDLKGERNLIKFSTQLNSASELLQKGDYQGARTLLTEVSNALNEMVFKPSLKKVMALTDIATPDLKATDLNAVETFFATAVDSYHQGEFQATKLLDYMRALGINHEAESFQKLIPQLSGASADSQQQSESSKAFSNSMRKDLFNIKEVLLTLANSSENVSVEEKVKANSAISAIHANQYQNKWNEHKPMQEISLHIPLKLNEQVADVKVFIKSSQKNMKLDFANFNMYFVIHTESEGEIGIRVSALDLKLKVEIKNDVLAGASDLRIQDARSSFKKHLESVGYSLIELKVSKFEEELSTISPNHVEEKNPQNLSFSKGGFDLQV